LNLNSALEVAFLWYKPLFKDFCENRKIELSLEYQRFQRLQKNRMDGKV